LAQEIRDVLKAHGFWVPKEWAGSELIMAVAKALDEGRPLLQHGTMGPDDPMPPPTQNERDLWVVKRVPAIRAYRNRTGLGLLETYCAFKGMTLRQYRDSRHADVAE